MTVYKINRNKKRIPNYRFCWENMLMFLTSKLETRLMRLIPRIYWNKNNQVFQKSQLTLDQFVGKPGK